MEFSRIVQENKEKNAKTRIFLVKVRNRRIMVASGMQLRTLTTHVLGQPPLVDPKGPENGFFADISKTIELIKKTFQQKL